MKTLTIISEKNQQELSIQKQKLIEVTIKKKNTVNEPEKVKKSKVK